MKTLITISLLFIVSCSTPLEPIDTQIKSEQVNTVTILKEAPKDSVMLPDKYCIDVDGEYICNF